MEVAIQHQLKDSIAIVHPKFLDFKSLVQLQQASFFQIIQKTETGYLFSEAYYRWKYFSPLGAAKIALLHDEKGLVAANSMYPQDIIVGNNRTRGWQLCDIATHPRGRAKGYFLRCAQALEAELGPEELFFCYPNHNSRPGLEKLGWTNHTELRTWARVLPGRKTTSFKFIESIENFNEAQDIFFTELAQAGGPMLYRSSAYMNWRYNQHPFHQYQSFVWYEAGHILGLIVLRRTKFLGKELALIMESHALTGQVERGLLAFAAAWAYDQGAKYTITLNNTTQTINGIRSAYVPVPKWALPKRVLLMTAPSNSQRSKATYGIPWRVHLGDGDAF